MNPLATCFFLVCAIVLLSVPRKWAPIPLLVGCCYMTMGQGIDLGPISLPIYRMLLLVGIARVVVKGEHIEGPLNKIDKLMIGLGGWIVFASFFHDGVLGSGPVYASGLVFNMAAVYFLIRIWCTDFEQVVGIVVIIAFLLAPIALEMMMEKITKVNHFSIFGGVPHNVAFREGKFRAQGPFRHPILAGTVGAVCIPLFFGILRRHRTAGIVGIASGIAIAVASASSGPIMSALAGGFGIMMWRFRHLTKLARVSAIAGYFAFSLYTGQPGYYIMKRIDVSGGSTGYHRARLIESAHEHIDEWWLFGTDFTRHWMATGVSYSPNHADITNYYLGFGVNAGLAAVLLLVTILIVAFIWVGIVCREQFEHSTSNSFMVWCLGAGMFAHAATSVSVSYFDQSIVFFWMNVALISSMYSANVVEKVADTSKCEEFDQDSTILRDKFGHPGPTIS